MVRFENHDWQRLVSHEGIDLLAQSEWRSGRSRPHVVDVCAPDVLEFLRYMTNYDFNEERQYQGTVYVFRRGDSEDRGFRPRFRR